MFTPVLLLLALAQIALTRGIPGAQGPIPVHGKRALAQLVDSIHQVPEDHNSIQAAIDAADFGDIIVVGPGVWSESFTLVDGVRVISSHGPAATVLEGTGTDWIVNASWVSRRTRLQGFTLRPGSAGSRTGVSLQGGNPTVVDCVFEGAFGGTGLLHSGAISSTWYSSPLVERCEFDGQGLANPNGAAWTFYVGAITFRNCLFTGYVAPSVITVSDGAVALANCTIVDNQASAITVSSGCTVIQNCILRNSTPIEVEASGGACIISYSNVRGHIGGGGNIDAVPRFAAPDTGDYRLLSGSPGIDAGNNRLIASQSFANLRSAPTPVADLSGESRVVDDPQTPDSGVGRTSVVDMGAYEWRP